MDALNDYLETEIFEKEIQNTIQVIDISTEGKMKKLDELEVGQPFTFVDDDGDARIGIYEKEWIPYSIFAMVITDNGNWNSKLLDKNTPVIPVQITQIEVEEILCD